MLPVAFDKSPDSTVEDWEKLCMLPGSGFVAVLAERRFRLELHHVNRGISATRVAKLDAIGFN